MFYIITFVYGANESAPENQDLFCLHDMNLIYDTYTVLFEVVNMK